MLVAGTSMRPEKVAYLQIEKGDVQGYEDREMIRLGSNTTIIGRQHTDKDSSNDIQYINILNQYISRKHFKIFYDGDADCFMVQERQEGSKNGTFLNHRQLEKDQVCKLKSGDRISLAKTGNEYQIVFLFKRDTDMTETLSSNVIADKGSSKGLEVDIDSRKVWLDGKEVTLRKKEFDLLAFLYQNQGRACSKNEIAEKVWQDVGGIVSQETIDTNIHRIRDKVETDPSNPRYIITLPRYGYRFDG